MLIAADQEKLQRIASEETLQGVRDAVRTIVEEDLLEDARNMAETLDELLRAYPDLAAQFPGVHAEYQQLLLASQCVALPMRSPDDVAAFLKTHYIAVLQVIGQNIKQKLTHLLTVVPAYDMRDEIKGKLRRALEENAEILTTSRIMFEGKDITPTVGNWIRDYTLFLAGSPSTSLRRAQYVSQGPNTIKLSNEDRNRVKYIVDLYGFLSLSSQTPEGVEDTIIIDVDGRLKMMKQGILEDIDPRAQQVIAQIRATDSAGATPTATTATIAKQDSLAPTPPRPIAPTPIPLRSRDDSLQSASPKALVTPPTSPRVVPPPPPAPSLPPDKQTVILSGAKNLAVPQRSLPAAGRLSPQHGTQDDVERVTSDGHKDAPKNQLIQDASFKFQENAPAPDPFSTARSLAGELADESKRSAVLQNLENEVKRLTERGLIPEDASGEVRGEIRDLVTIIARPTLQPFEKMLLEEGIEDVQKRLQILLRSSSES